MGNSASVAVPSSALVIAAGAALPPLCTVAVALRLCNNRRLDGWLTVPAAILLWGQGICLIYGAKKQALAAPEPNPPPGVDPDTWVSPEDILSSELFYAMLLIQIPCLTLIKLSFVFFYRRLFTARVQRRFLTWYLNILAACLVAWALAYFFSELFVCRSHFSVIFDATDAEQAADCIPFTPWDDSFAATDFILDLFICVTPIPLVFGLKLSRGQKWGAIGVFSLGGLAIAASVTRFVIFTDEDDLSFTTCLYWTCVESGIALLACGLPSTFGLFTNLHRKARERRERYKSYGSGKMVSGGSRTLVGKQGRSRLDSTTSANFKKPGIINIQVENTYTVDTEEMDLHSLTPVQT